jgi:hypothetical protein
MKRAIALLICTSVLLWYPSGAFACCQTAVSCVAAVVSAGTTCIVDAAISALEMAKRQLEKDHTSRKQEFDEALRQMEAEATAAVAQAQQIADDALRSLRASDADARRITGEDKARLQATLNQSVHQQAPPLNGSSPSTQSNRISALGTQTTAARIGSASAVPQAGSALDPLLERQKLLADGSLESMQRLIAIELKKATSIRQLQFASAQQAALAKQATAKSQMQGTFNDLIIVGFDALTVAIVKILQAQNVLEAPKLLTVVIAEAATLIERYQRQIEPGLRNAANQLEQQLEPMRAAAAMMQQHAANAALILAKMQQAVLVQSAAERQAMAAAVATVPGIVPTRTSVRLRTAATVFSASQRAIGGVTGLKANLEKVTAKPPPVNLAMVNAQVRSSFDQSFGGKPPAQAAMIRDRLLQEARARYGSDRTLLAAMESRIHAEARARGAP